MRPRLDQLIKRAIHYAATDEGRYVRFMAAAARTLPDDDWAALRTLVELHIGIRPTDP